MDVGDTISCQYGTCFCVVNHGFALPWRSYRDGGTEKPSQWLVPSFPSSHVYEICVHPGNQKSEDGHRLPEPILLVFFFSLINRSEPCKVP